jgi:norsolorinic acid ketoreductase
MASNTVFLITGANRGFTPIQPLFCAYTHVTFIGIGFALTASLLLRPSTTVIATVRSSATSRTELGSLRAAANGRLIVATLSSTSDTDATTLVSNLSSQHGVIHIDTVIANAGAGETFESSLSTPLSELRQSFEINTIGPIKLFQAAFPLLQRSTNPKFILISSSLGSIGAMEGNIPSLAYGVSKAAANYFVRKVHFEHEEVTAVALHPGLVFF